MAKWSPEMEEVIKVMRGARTDKEIAQIINAEFGTELTRTVVKQKRQRMGLNYQFNCHHYTEEQNEWLHQNVSKYTFRDLAVQFNETFNTNIRYDAIRGHCMQKGYKGGRAWEKGFRMPRAPIGTEYIAPNGDIWVKASDTPTKRNGEKNHHTNWKKKAHIVWEQHHGEIPQGSFIVFLDGDRSNCDISNLECTTNSIQGYLTMKTLRCSPELRRCAIKMKTLEKILVDTARE